MVYAGFSHLTFNRVDFQAQVPDWLPLSKDLVVLLSGSRNSFGSWISFLEKERVTFGWYLRYSSFWCFPAILRSTSTKRCFGALNSDNSRLIRLFSNRCLLLGPYGQLVRLKPETTKLKLI
jgi:hypothetical protein